MSQNLPTWFDPFFDKIISENNVPLPQQPTLEFEGAGVAVSDDPSNGRTKVTITGASIGQQAQGLSNGLNSNVATNGKAVVRVTGPTAAYSIDGFAWPTTPVGGERFVLVNTVNFPLSIINNGAGSAVGNKITTLRQVQVTLPTAGSSCAFVFDATANMWTLEHIGTARPEYFNVLDFGVVADGVTDCQPGTAAAIAAAIAQGFAGIYFPPGLYNYLSGLTISSAVAIIGYGLNSGGLGTLTTPFPTLIKSFIGDLFHFDGASGVAALGGGIEGIRIVQAAGVAPMTITGATNASPIVLQTAAPHGLVNGNVVGVSGVLGNTAANNTLEGTQSWPILVVDPTHFSLTGSVGNGGYGGGGTAVQLTGTAIKLDCSDSNHKPTWFHIRKVFIEEDNVHGSWTFALSIDGSNAVTGQGRILDTRIQELSTHTSGPGTGALRLIACTGTASFCDFNIKGHVYASGTLAWPANWLMNNVQIGGFSDLFLDFVVDFTFLGGVIGGLVTSTANAAGKCNIQPGLLDSLAAGINDNASSHMGVFYYDNTVLSGGVINGSFRSNRFPALANSQQFAAVVTLPAPGATWLIGVDAGAPVNMIRICELGDLPVGIGSNPGRTNAAGGDLVLTNLHDYRITDSGGNSEAFVSIDATDHCWLAKGSTLPVRLGPGIGPAATGGGTPAVLGTMGGGAGQPTTGAQNGWVEMIDNAGNPFYIPCWR